MRNFRDSVVQSIKRIWTNPNWYYFVGFLCIVSLPNWGMGLMVSAFIGLFWFPFLYWMYPRGT